MAKKSKAVADDPLAAVLAAANAAEPVGMKALAKTVGDADVAETAVSQLLRERKLFEASAKGKERRFTATDRLPEFVEEIWSLTERPISVVAVAKELAGKSPDAPGPTRIAQHLETEVAKFRMFRVGVDDRDPPNILYCRTTTLQRIETAAAALAKPFAPKALAKSVGVTETQALAALEAMVEDGVLYRRSGSKDAPAKYFKEPAAKRASAKMTAGAALDMLVQTLESLKARADGSYPTTFAKAAEAAGFAQDADALAKIESKALADARFATLAGHLLLAADVEAAISKPEFAGRLAAKAVAKLRTEERRGFTPGEIAASSKLSKDLQSKLATALAGAVRGGAAPNLAWIETKAGPVAFLASDVQGMPAPPVAKVAPRLGVDDFVREFPLAFDRLDAKAGRHNFVSLVGLRRELARYARADFDEGLLRLCEARRFALEPPSGAPSAEERAAGVLEHGRLLLFVKRRRDER